MRGDLQIDAVQQDGSTLAAVIFLNQGCTFQRRPTIVYNAMMTLKFMMILSPVVPLDLP